MELLLIGFIIGIVAKAVWDRGLGPQRYHPPELLSGPRRHELPGGNGAQRLPPGD